MHRGRISILAMALAVVGSARVAAQGLRALDARVQSFREALDSESRPTLPQRRAAETMQRKVRRAAEQAGRALEPGPRFPPDTVDMVRDTVRHVGDVALSDWVDIYQQMGGRSNSVEVPIAASLRAEWIAALGRRLGAGEVASVEDLPVPDPRLTHLLVRAWAVGPAGEADHVRLENMEVLDTLGAFEIVFGESFQAGLGEGLRRWIASPPEDGPDEFDPDPPPRSTGRQIVARAEDLLGRWPREVPRYETLGEAAARSGVPPGALGPGEAPSLLRIARYESELRELLERERALYDQIVRARQVLAKRSGEFHEALGGHLDELQDGFSAEELRDVHDIFRNPHASQRAREELQRHLELWAHWRMLVIEWIRAGGGLETFPLPDAPVVKALLEVMRGTLENPERGHDHVFTRAESLSALDEIGFFEAAVGEAFFPPPLAWLWAKIRDESLGEIELNQRLRVLEMQLGARIGQVLQALGRGDPATFGEAFALRGKTLGGPVGDEASLLRIAYALATEPEVDSSVGPPPGEGLPAEWPTEVGPPPLRPPGPPPTPPSTEVAPPPTFLVEPQPLPPPPAQPGFPVVPVGIALALGAGATAIFLRLRDTSSSSEVAAASSSPPSPPQTAEPTTPPTVVPLGPTPAGPTPVETRMQAPPSEPTDARTRVSQPGTSAATVASLPPGSDTVASTPGALSGETPPPPPAPGEGLPSWLRATLEGALGDRYQNHVLLGAGGMGTVVRAFDTRLERTVAVKVPPPHLASHEQFQVRFLREARAVARLDHPNIGRVIDVPEVPAGELPVMILEYLDGVDLSTYLDRQGRPPGRVALGWIRQAGAGLQHAHEQGILHRDIKPANLMLVNERVKILDFGLAALEDRKGLTQSGMLMGSIPYMPPEQLRGEAVGIPADVYALGVTAFQLLTGKLPFAPEDAKRLNVPRISQAGTGAPAILDDLLLRALAPDPAERYGSVKEMLAAIADLARKNHRG